MFSGQDKQPKGAKHAPTAKSGAERRQRQMLSIRHKAHGELMKHVRSEGFEGDDEPELSEQQGPMDPWAYDGKSPPASIPPALLPQLVQMVASEESMEAVYQGTLLIRKLLSVEENPPYQLVISTGVVPNLINLLDHDENPNLQFEAAWALTNIASGTSENTTLLVNGGAVPKLIKLLGSPNTDCRDQSCWALGNLAGEGASCRDVALEAGAMPALLTIVTTPEQPLNVMRNAVWTISNLCRSKPVSPLYHVGMALPVLASLINHGDEQIVVDAAWALSYISDSPSKGSPDTPSGRIQAVLDAGVLPRVVALLGSPTGKLQTPAIRTVGNIAVGDDVQTQEIINAGALNAMHVLLASPKRALRKEACWTVSNIAAGLASQIEALINANLVPSILDCLRAPELDVKKEAAWTINNLCYSGTREQTKYVITAGAVSPLCETLGTYDAKIVQVALEAIQRLLEVGDEEKQMGTTLTNIVADQIQECGGIDLIEGCQNHADKQVYVTALEILEGFFQVDDATGLGDNGAMDFGNENATPAEPFNFT